MAVELRKGQKADLTKNNPNLKEILVTLNWQADSSIEIDTSAFLLGDNGKVSSDDDFVFYGNQNHSSQSVQLQNNQIKINLSRVPATVSKIAITLTIYSRHNFSQVKNTMIKVNDILQFNFGENLSVETAIVVAEIYRHKGEWKFNAIGAGFSGGLEALCKNFGVDVSDTPSPPSSSPQSNSPSPPQSTGSNRSTSKVETKRQPFKFDSNNQNQSSIKNNSTAPPPPPKKIELRKGQKISLVKTGKTLGEIVINLNWSQPQQQKSSGFLDRIFGNSSKGVDLDLGCLFELQNGDKGVVQALGNAFGELNHSPYIALDGDDRTGSVAAGETIRVNGKFVDKIKRILVYTFIYDGVAQWREVDGIVTVKCPGSPDIIVRMDEYGSKKRLCGIALLENTGSTFSVEKIVKFYDNQRYLDEDFDWGLQWQVGRKD
ncbi:MAG: TerD domain-containing protein [Selenomonadaceae bacterium]|nr:TerD domain-containing protein [Selenomonadaceae bacterium]